MIKTNQKLLSLIILLLLMQPIQAQNYQHVWEEDYAIAEATMIEYCPQFTLIAEANGMDTKEAMAVVFPETLRYSLVRDLLETEMVEFGYVNYGGNFADFSIGAFQMKPSFIERLEQYVCSNNKLKGFQSLFSYSSTTPKGIRTERVEKLKKMEYQLEYLSCFLAIAFQEYEELNLMPPQERVKILAALFNAGFGYNLEELNKLAALKIFPYGSAFGKNQYSYAGISQDFYLKYSL